MQADRQAYRQKEKVTNVLIDQLDCAHHNSIRDIGLFWLRHEDDGDEII